MDTKRSNRRKGSKNWSSKLLKSLEGNYQSSNGSGQAEVCMEIKLESLGLAEDAQDKTLGNLKEIVCYRTENFGFNKF